VFLGWPNSTPITNFTRLSVKTARLLIRLVLTEFDYLFCALNITSKQSNIMTRTLSILAIFVSLLSAASCKKDVENKVPVADAGPSQNVTLPDSVVLTGAGTDADGNVVAHFWSQVSGPANSTIVNPGATSTAIKFKVPGSYLFQLMVTDNEGAPGTDTVLVQVSGSKIERNKVPVVDAGPAQTITLPDSVVLSGTGTDADGKVMAYLWSQVSGPNTSSIVNPGTTSTVVRFNHPGSYLFQLMAVDDKGAVGVDTVSVVVNATIINTLTLQPANNPYEINLAALNTTDSTYVPTYDLPVMIWLRENNAWFEVRSLIKFDLSSIPVNSTIVSANLYLYSYPSPTMSGNGTDANWGPQNSMGIYMNRSNWSPATVNWANQPEAFEGPTTGDTQVRQLDLNTNVTSLVTYMVRNNVNYGFKLQIINRNPYYNTRIFVSSHNPNPNFASKHPKLVVVYKRSV
jgi:hypothetical protein